MLTDIDATYLTEQKELTESLQKTHKIKRAELLNKTNDREEELFVDDDDFKKAVGYIQKKVENTVHELELLDLENNDKSPKTFKKIEKELLELKNSWQSAVKNQQSSGLLPPFDSDKDGVLFESLKKESVFRLSMVGEDDSINASMMLLCLDNNEDVREKMQKDENFRKKCLAFKRKHEEWKGLKGSIRELKNLGATQKKEMLAYAKEMEAKALEVIQKKLEELWIQRAEAKFKNRVGRQNQEQFVYESWLAYLGGKEGVVITVQRAADRTVTGFQIDTNGLVSFTKLNGGQLQKIVRTIDENFSKSKYVCLTGENQQGVRNQIAIHLAEKGYKIDLKHSDLDRDTKCKVVKIFAEKIIESRQKEYEEAKQAAEAENITEGDENFPKNPLMSKDKSHIKYMQKKGLRLASDETKFKAIKESDLQPLVRFELTESIRSYVRKTLDCEIIAEDKTKLVQERRAKRRAEFNVVNRRTGRFDVVDEKDKHSDIPAAKLQFAGVEKTNESSHNNSLSSNK